MQSTKYLDYCAYGNILGVIFNGQRKGEPMSKRGIQFIMRQTLKNSNIQKQVTLHSLRHAYATHFLEDTGDLFSLKENGFVTFKYKIYKKGGKVETMPLKILEFIRRFALHILPHGFARMRHYGLLSSKGQVTYLPVVQQYMNIKRPKKSKLEIRYQALQRLKTNNACPCCGHKNLRQILPFPRGEPPDEIYILNIVLNYKTHEQPTVNRHESVQISPCLNVIF